jgi:hypothetical protein
MLECGGDAGGERPRLFRVGVDGGGARTTIRFADGPAADLQQASVMARLEWLARPRLTVFAGAGSVLGGTVRADGADHQLRPGWLASAGVAWLAVAEAGRRPFVSASVMLGYLAAHTRLDDASSPVPWRAADARVGVTAGKTFGPARPYLVGRAFGGPVSWRAAGGQSITGGDSHHYQLGAGVALALPAYFDLSVEVAPLGEQGLAGGIGYRF